MMPSAAANAPKLSQSVLPHGQRHLLRVAELESFGEKMNPAQMQVPTEADWRSEEWGLDEPYAYENFYSKSLEEAEMLFAEGTEGFQNALSRQEDVSVMPFRCFQFYVWAYMNYLLSERSKSDADGASAFMDLVEWRQEDFRRIGSEAVTAALRVLDRIASSQGWYDADLDIYGDFHERATEVRRHLHV